MKPDRTPMARRPRVPPKPKTVERKMEQDPVEVFCRIRPKENPEEEPCVVVVDTRTVKLSPPVASFAFRNGNAKEQEYKFQRVFGPTTSQKDLFNTVAKPLVSDLLRGKNGLLFAYGVTGSGKTYTMQGTSQDGGILLRTLDVIFNSISENQAKRCMFKPDGMNGFEWLCEAEASEHRRRVDATPQPRMPGHRYRREANGSHNSSDRVPDSSRVSSVDDDSIFSVFVSYIEIYNNYIYDLLEETSDLAQARGFQAKILREDASHNMYVNGCNEIEVKSTDDALELLYRGQKKRKIAYTRLNCESSRSHSIFGIRIVQAPLDENGEDIITDRNCITVSQLSLVDLAGSERNTRTKATGDRVKEAGNINNSLMTLRACIETLRENQITGGSRMVPYRDSKLTHFFKNYFDGEGKVKMVVCVNPKADDYDETLPVMKFAELASEVQVQRSTYSAKHELGLPTGRRRANQLFREAQKRLEEQNTPHIKNIAVDLTPVYNLAPAWPPVSWTPETKEEIITKLKPYLIKLSQNREKMIADIQAKSSMLGKLILKMENENIVLRQENASLQSMYDDALNKIRNLEAMVLETESANDSLQRKFTNYDNLVDECNAVREELDMAKNQGHLEKQRMKARLKSKLEAEKERLKKEMILQLNEHKSKTFKKGVKVLQEVLLDCNTPNSSVLPSIVHTKPTPSRYRVRPTKSDPKLEVNEAHSVLDLPSTTSKPSLRRSKSFGSDGLELLNGENTLRGDILAQTELLSASRKRSSGESRARSGASSQENLNAGGKRARF
ncbi:LOW QUALITY PROTEIN: kinesin-like protein KIF23 [Macrobrachium nipponense]|uniref:LOW QUALITY PROTEIN: kinesin-like protein KIF23 n=1 Tax=Macrobrachium nipponense TaxID=159736 RepID=UPI0030C8774F